VFLVMALGYVVHLLPSRWKSNYRHAFVNAPLSLQLLFAIGAVSFSMAILSAGGTPFIYFQF
jgi:alginate O-acetyltransferase complex protein AlgI